MRCALILIFLFANLIFASDIGLLDRAINGDTEAQRNLGLAYYDNGNCFEQFMAVQLIKLSANQGNSEAQRNLGMAYLHGLGISRDEVEALKWFKLSAEQGNAQAQYSLGIVYIHGYDAFLKNEIEGIKWLELSAEQEYAEAQYDLGRIYFNGYRVPKDETMGLNLLKKSCDNGLNKGCKALLKFSIK